MLTIQRQLDVGSSRLPVFGPTKTGRSRTVTLDPDTVTTLRTHRKAQATLKMANRTTYEDYGLVFAKEAADLQTPTAKLGQPILTLSRAGFHRVRRQPTSGASSSTACGTQRRRCFCKRACQFRRSHDVSGTRKSR